MTGFREGFRVQRRVLKALFLREIITRYGRRHLGFTWLFLEPLMFAGGIMAIWSAIKPPYEHGVRLIPFILTGYLPLTLFRHSLSRAMNTITANADLLYHRNITCFDLYLMRLYLEFVGTTFAFFIAAAFLFRVGLIDAPGDFPLVLAGWLYMGWFAFSVALLIGTTAELQPVVEKFVPPLNYLMLPLSGAFYMVEWLPPSLRSAVGYVPTVHAFEMIRAGFLGDHVKAHFDVAYLTASCGILTLAALWMVRNIRSRLAIG